MSTGAHILCSASAARHGSGDGQNTEGEKQSSAPKQTAASRGLSCRLKLSIELSLCDHSSLLLLLFKLLAFFDKFGGSRSISTESSP